MSTNAPDPYMARSPIPEGRKFPGPPPKQLGTVRIEVSDLPEVREALSRATGRIKDLEKENQTLKDTLEAWQAVVRVAREKDSTLPDPEAVPC